MKNILITGGLGYIGGRIASYISETNPDTNIVLTTRKENVNLPKWTKPFKVSQMNVLDENSINKCVQGIDIIIHLAAINEIDSMKEPELALKINTKGTYELLKNARKHNVNNFIYFSTYHVYGDTPESIITEKIATRPLHPYAITHRAAEDFVNFFKYYYKMNTLILRLSNGYGYPMSSEINRWTLVFNDLCRQAVTSARIVLKSSGKKYRDFITLHDVARAVQYFIFDIADKWGDGLFNLGGDSPKSILDIAEKISEVYFKKYQKNIIEIVKVSEANNANENRLFSYCISKIKNTGFQLSGDMETEILKTMDICEEFCR